MFVFCKMNFSSCKSFNYHYWIVGTVDLIKPPQKTKLRKKNQAYLLKNGNPNTCFRFEKEKIRDFSFVTLWL